MYAILTTYVCSLRIVMDTWYRWCIIIRLWFNHLDDVDTGFAIIYLYSWNLVYLLHRMRAQFLLDLSIHSQKSRIGSGALARRPSAVSLRETVTHSIIIKCGISKKCQFCVDYNIFISRAAGSDHVCRSRHLQSYKRPLLYELICFSYAWCQVVTQTNVRTYVRTLLILDS